jgi:hypothetical protein
MNWNLQIFLEEGLGGPSRQRTSLAHSASRLRRQLCGLQRRGEGSPTSLQISEMQPHQSSSAGSFLLPEQAILLQLTVKGSLGVEYWDSALYPGGGAANADLLALTTVAAVDPAWIAWELRTNELVELQMDRARLGATIPRIDRSLVLRLCLPLPELKEQENYANTLRGIIRENQSLSRAQKNIEAAKRSQREFVVTGISVQDRLRQFEDYLNSEKWITPGSVFRLDQVEGTPRFTVRPIGQTRKHAQSAHPLPTEVQGLGSPSYVKLWHSMGDAVLLKRISPRTKRACQASPLLWSFR